MNSENTVPFVNYENKRDFFLLKYFIKYRNQVIPIKTVNIAILFFYFMKNTFF